MMAGAAGAASFGMTVGESTIGALADSGITITLPPSESGKDYILIFFGSGATATATPSGFTQLYLAGATGQYPQLGVWGKPSAGESSVYVSTGTLGQTGRFYAIVVKGTTKQPVVTGNAGTGGAAVLPNAPAAQSVCVGGVAQLLPGNIGTWPAQLSQQRKGAQGSTLGSGLWGAADVMEPNEACGTFSMTGKSEWRNALAAFTL